MNKVISLLIFLATVGCGTPKKRLYRNYSVIVHFVPKAYSLSAFENAAWEHRKLALSKVGCGDVVDVAREWAGENDLPFEIRDVNFGRVGYFDTISPLGYFFVEVSWDPKLLGTTPVRGYMIEFRISFYSADALDSKGRLDLFARYDVPLLVDLVEASARNCGAF